MTLKNIKLTPQAVGSLRAASHHLSAENGGTRITLSETVILLCRNNALLHIGPPWSGLCREGEHAVCDGGACLCPCHGDRNEPAPGAASVTGPAPDWDTLPEPASAPLIDPDCRDGKHVSCVGGPCECLCHESPQGLAGDETGVYQP